MTDAAWMFLFAWGFGEKLMVFIVLYKAYAWRNRIDCDIYVSCLPFVVTVWSGLVILLFIWFLPNTGISQYNRSLCYQYSILRRRKKKKPLHNIETKAAIVVTGYWSTSPFLKLVGICCWGRWGRKERWKRPHPIRCRIPSRLRAMRERADESLLWNSLFVLSERLFLLAVLHRIRGVTMATKIHMPVFQQRALYSGRGFNSLSLFPVTWLSVTLRGQSFCDILFFFLTKC